MKFRDSIPTTDGGHFLKIKDGESVVGIFRGEPYDFYVLWKDKKSEVVPPGTNGARFRFRINFVTKDATGYQAKIWEQGVSVYDDLKNLDKALKGEGSLLEETVIKIIRKGSTKDDTTYTFLPLGSKVGPDVKAVTLQNLKLPQQTASVPVPDFGPSPVYENDDEIPF